MIVAQRRGSIWFSVFMAELFQFSTVLLVLHISCYMTECPNIKRMNISLTIYTFIYSSINEYLDCIALEQLYIEHLWTEVNTYPLVILWLPLRTIYLEVKYAGSYAGYSYFWRNPHTVFHNWTILHFANDAQGSNFPTSLPTHFKNRSHPSGYEVLSHCSLN